MEIFLHRFCQVPPGTGIAPGTFGSIQIDGEHIAYSVEQPWNNNKPFKSCVPDGKYRLIPYESEKYGDCFFMVNHGLNVYAYRHERVSDDDRYGCLFVHRGNYPENFEGCVGAGKRLAINENIMVTSSVDTCKHIMDTLGRDEHDLIIYSTPGAI